RPSKEHLPAFRAGSVALPQPRGTSSGNIFFHHGILTTRGQLTGGSVLGARSEHAATRQLSAQNTWGWSRIVSSRRRPTLTSATGTATSSSSRRTYLRAFIGSFANSVTSLTSSAQPGSTS